MAEDSGFPLEVEVTSLVAPGVTGIPSIDARYGGKLEVGQTIRVRFNEARALQGLSKS